MPEQVLQQAEESGLESSGNSELSGGVDDARNAEESFVSNVTNKDDDSNSKKRGKKRKRKISLSKAGPIIAIVSLLAVAVVIVLVAQGVMPFAVVNRLIEEYNTNGISSVLRADNVLDVQMSTQPGTTFALGKHQLSALKDNDILPVEYGNGTLLAYKKSGGSWNVVKGTVPESPDVNGVLSSLKTTYSGYDFGGSISFISVKDAYDDPDFKIPYITASKTWRGGNSGWYDQLATLAENVHGYQRSRWFSFNAKSIAGGATTFFKSLASSSLKDADANFGDAYRVEESVTLEDGTTTTTETDVSKSVNLKGLDIAAKFVSAANAASDLACGAVMGFIGVQTVVSTYQRLQKINLVSGFMESVQSVQAGDSSGGPMNEYSNTMTAIDPETGTTAVEGMGPLFTDEPVDANDEGVTSVNTEKALASISDSSDNRISALFADIVSSGNNLLSAFKVCNYIKGGLAIANLALTVASFIPIIGQGIKAIQLTVTGVIKAAFTALIVPASKVVADLLIKRMGKKLLENIATEWVGKSLGHAYLSGGNETLSGNHQTGGGSLGDSTSVGIFRQEQQRIIAEEAEYQRAIRSPFDITNGHTFLGSIVYGMIPLANSSGIGSIIKNISSTMTNSVSKLLPSASAAAVTNMIDTAKSGDCPVIQSMEANNGTLDVQADIYCNPLFISDQSTVDSSLTMEDVVEWEISQGYVKRNECGELEVVDNTELSDYIMYCGQRTSSWGLADANIGSAISNKSPLSKLSAIPLIGDVAAISEAATNQLNLPWTTGSACVASANNNYWKNNKYHQRFIEDQRLLSDTGNVDNNPVYTYLEDYYKKNPLDNSFEGVLARFSGMTKDDVIAALDLIEGLTYLANYHPEERYAFGEKEPETNLQFEQTEVKLIATEPKYIVYNTLRNRAVLV